MRRTPLRRTSRLAPISKKRAAGTEDRRAIRERVYARDGWRCRLLASVGATYFSVNEDGLRGPYEKVPPCFGPLTPHHLLKASAGGPYTLDNLVTLCAGHNTWVEDHPATATALGLVIRRSTP